ncbi:MAG: hypothetical protein ABSA96_03440 [Candidatus Acidiferrales bacterium]
MSPSHRKRTVTPIGSHNLPTPIMNKPRTASGHVYVTSLSAAGDIIGFGFSLSPWIFAILLADSGRLSALLHAGREPHQLQLHERST